jgi:exosortase sorting signal-containing protein
MLNKKSILALAAPFLVFSFLLFALPEIGISSVPQGCCINEATDSCVGCVDGCATQEDFCIEQGGTVAGEGICFDSPVGAICGETASEVGCCVVSPGECVDNTDSRGCFDTELGITWNPGNICSQVAECTVTRNIPTLSEWGLIAMAGILGIAGLIIAIRKRNLTA